jgi:vacuolar-type H+-ATPase subunit E/Vma4
MSIDKILKKIEDDAHKEAEQILLESEQRAEQIKKKAHSESAVLAEAIMKESEKQARLEVSRILTQARLERKLEILSSKKELIDGVLEKAFKKVGHDRSRLKKEVIEKEGRREENLDEQTLIDELRPKLEKFIVDVLKI